jgi:hypothetical protein
MDIFFICEPIVTVVAGLDRFYGPKLNCAAVGALRLFLDINVFLLEQDLW